MTATPQEELELLLRHKGIGPQGSKSLKEDQLLRLEDLFKDGSVSITTKATMLTALLTLDSNEAEAVWISKLPEILDEGLKLFLAENNEAFLSLIQKTISRNDLSKEEANIAMEYFCDENVPQYLKASFLEAQRLKRETHEENLCFLDSMWSQVSRIQTDMPLIIDIADAYDGCNRTYSFTPFVAAVLASLGYPCLIHGVESVAPKQGWTQHQILKRAGKNPLMSLSDVAFQMENKEIGWGYVDQSVYDPSLYSLLQMRKEMVKRPFLATFEKLLQPIRAKNGNTIITGYTHKAYKEGLVNLLKSHEKVSQALILRGSEGSTQLNMAKDTTWVKLDSEYNISDGTIHPSALGLSEHEMSPNKSLTAQDCLEVGVAALKGEQSYGFENITYVTAIILSQLGLADPQSITAKIKDAILSGKSFFHWENGCR